MSFYAKIRILVLIMIFSIGCKEREIKKINCETSIGNMKMYSIVSYQTDEPASIISNWYHSEFQNEQLHFSIEFSHYGDCYGDVLEYSWVNDPLLNTIEISCSKDILVGIDTIKANESLNEFFLIERIEHKRFIGFFISEILNKKIQLDSTYYTFTTELTTVNNEVMQDECLIKIK